jgi:mRNA interferase MazF
MSQLRGDVVLVRVDFSDRSGRKVRPAVVVSSDAYNRGPDLLLASITSNLSAIPHPGDHVITDWQGAGLRRPSLLQTKVFIVEQSLVQSTLGRLRPNDLAALDRGLITALGLSSAVQL